MKNNQTEHGDSPIGEMCISVHEFDVNTAFIQQILELVNICSTYIPSYKML